MMAPTQSSPAYHTEKIKSEMNALIQHLREDVNKVDDPQFKALLETSAEVVGGLAKAFNDYQQKNEAAWKR
jgi:ABC-type transporter Mla subunit MlaD